MVFFGEEEGTGLVVVSSVIPSCQNAGAQCRHRSKLNLILSETEVDSQLRGWLVMQGARK